MSGRKIVQLSVVVRDIEKAMERYWKILGIGPLGRLYFQSRDSQGIYFT